MSSPSSTPSTGADQRSTAAPYAFPPTGNAPVGRAPQSARGPVGPYVPAPWRGTPAAESVRAVPTRSVTPRAVEALLAPEMPPSYPTPAYFTPLGSPAQDEAVPEDSRLPWIDAFLASTPALAMRAVAEPVREPVADPVADPVASFTPPSPGAIAGESLAAAMPPMSDAVPEVPTPSDAWALDEAADQMRALADELRERERLAGDSGEVAPLLDGMSSSEPLSAWDDDDMIDIMPLQQERSSAADLLPTLGASRAIEPWADRARRSGDEDAESAARALEVLARRVRDREISLAGYEPRLGDAAALAAALAALLGVRR